MEKKILVLAIYCLLIEYSYSQVCGGYPPWCTIGNTISGTEYMGGDGSSTIPLNLKTITAYPINFYTANTQRMTILGAINPGFVGIGNTFSPNFKLDIDAGDVNLNTATFGFRINGNYVLRHNAISSNIFVGVGAGNANATSSNTFIGYNTGILTGNSGVTSTNAKYNTFVGHVAGTSNDQGFNNSFLGDSAGYNNTSGYQNIFIGGCTGVQNQTGKSNTLIGFEAGHSCVADYNTIVGRNAGYDNGGYSNSFFGKDAGMHCTGSNNTYMGSHAGFNSGYCSANTFIGLNSGYQIAGDGNTFLGNYSGVTMTGGHDNTYIGNHTQDNASYPNLWNSAAIGANAIATGSNQMILGDDSVNVGIGLSGNATGPRSKLEIESGATGVSGLQFRDLTSSYSPGLSDSKFLTVASDGKVILRDELGNVSACTTGVADYVTKFTAGTVICKSQIYDDATNVGIGTTTVPQKLNVDGNINMNTYADGLYLNNERFLTSEGDGYAYNIYLGLNAGPPGLNTNSGYGDICIGDHSGYNLSDASGENVFIGADAGRNTTGIYGDRNSYLGHSSGVTNTIGYGNVAVGDFAGSSAALDSAYGNTMLGMFAGGAGDGNENVVIGYYAHIREDSTHNNSIAIGAGSWVDGDCSVAIGSYSSSQTDNTIALGSWPVRTVIGYAAAPTLGTSNFRLYVNYIGGGDVAYFNGNIFCAGSYNGSDSSLKKNIETLDAENSSNLIGQLKPKTFEFDRLNNPSLNLNPGLQYGLIAEDVERVLPGLVKEVTSPPVKDSLGQTIYEQKTFKAINYIGLIPLLLKYGQVQKNKIDSLITRDSINNARMDRLEELINNCCQSQGGSGHKSNAIDVELGSENNIILNQNDPNPFAEETRITYNIPVSVSEAKIIFFDNTGHIIQTVKINERGEGQINVFASNLTSGIYSYSLIADGKVIDTKKMVCSK